MCIRWMSLGAFYPFSRNHYGDSNDNLHEPWMTPKLATASKAVLEERYKILPYLYTLFYEAHTAVRPYVLHALIFDWADDETVWLPWRSSLPTHFVPNACALR